MKSLLGILVLAVIFKLTLSPEFATYLLIGLVLLLFALMVERIFQS
jgi:hypothetical protein